jgi:hypothetical protein
MILVCKEKAEQFPKVDPRLASYFTIFEMEKLGTGLLEINFK